MATAKTQTQTQTPAPSAAEMLGVSEEFLDGAESGYAVREAMRERSDKVKGFFAGLLQRQPKAKEERVPRTLPPHLAELIAKRQAS